MLLEDARLGFVHHEYGIARDIIALHLLPDYTVAQKVWLASLGP